MKTQLESRSAAIYIVALFSVFGLYSGCATNGSSESNRQWYAIEASAEARKITEASGKEWVVSTQGRAATDAVDTVISAGGNIIDAAVAASFVISVERPQSTGLGGGGFLLYREAKSGKIYALDFRERAPQEARERTYVDARGDIVPDRSLVGIQAVGVPGLVRGLSDLHRRFGKMKWAKLVDPAVRLAEDGLLVYPYLAKALVDKTEILRKFPSSKKIFLKVDGMPYAEGEKIIQTDLARTLREIGKKPNSFYEGRIAQAIEDTTEGWISTYDLKSYRSKWREPVRGTFKTGPIEYEVISMPPPSSGGTHVIQILNQLEKYNLRDTGLQTTETLHRLATAMQLAFLDRARYMGDPDWVEVPVKTLISKEHSNRLELLYDPKRALSADVSESRLRVLPEHSETTHFSIMDAAGNVVVSTQTINGWFGSGLVAEGTGIVLNNEMDDFSSKPGSSNLFGAIGSRANAVQPGKTPLSSMSPTIVMQNGVPRLALGAPGGTRIITCVAQTILNYLVHGLTLYESVNALRIHQQWKPDVLRLEMPGMGERTEKELTRLGWRIEKGPASCAVMAVAREGKNLIGVSEPRDHGKAFAR